MADRVAAPAGVEPEPGVRQVVPNLVMAKIGAGGTVSLRNQSGQVHRLADVAGSFTG